MKYLLLFISIFFFPSVIFSQNKINQKKIDSLLIILNAKKEDTSKVNLYHKIFLLSRDLDLKTITDYNLKLLNLSKKIQYERGIGLYYLDNYYIFLKRDIAKSIYNSDQARKKFLKVKDTLYYLKATSALGDAYLNGNKNKEASQILLDCLPLSISKPHLKMTGFIYQQIGNCFLSDNSLKKSLEYFKKSLEYHEKENSTDNHKAFLYVSMAYVCNKLYNHKEALQYANLSITFAKRDVEKHYMTLEKINTYLCLNRYDEALQLALINDTFYVKNKLTFNNNYIYNLLFVSKSFYNLRKYNLAINVSNKILNQPNLSDDLKRDANKLLANSYFKLGEKQEAVKYIDKAIAFSNSLNLNNKEVTVMLYLDKSNIEESLGNHKLALLYHKKYTNAKEVIEKRINDDRVRVLQTEFNVTEKENKIKNLQLTQLEKNTQINTQKNFIIYGAIFLLLVLLSLFIFIKTLATIKNKNTIISVKNTALENANEIIEQSLQNKETLLKEIHHRVKNNLQLVMSLLYIQSKQKDTNMQDFLEISQSRITAMAFIHENLYQTNDLSKVDFRQYIETLTQSIVASYNKINQSIQLHIDVQSIHLDIQTAIPLGLIINELISNAYKHAFINQNNGDITLQLIQNQSKYELLIKDNGVGVITKKQPSKSLGLELVKQLVQQINGVLEVQDKLGMQFKIQFQNIKL